MVCPATTIACCVSLRLRYCGGSLGAPRKFILCGVVVCAWRRRRRSRSRQLHWSPTLSKATGRIDAPASSAARRRALQRLSFLATRRESSQQCTARRFNLILTANDDSGRSLGTSERAAKTSSSGQRWRQESLSAHSGRSRAATYNGWRMPTPCIDFLQPRAPPLSAATTSTKSLFGIEANSTVRPTIRWPALRSSPIRSTSTLRQRTAAVRGSRLGMNHAAANRPRRRGGPAALSVA